MTTMALGSASAAIAPRIQLGRGVGAARSPRPHAYVPRASGVAPASIAVGRLVRSKRGRLSARITRAAFSDKEGDANQLERQARNLNGSSHLNGGLNGSGGPSPPLDAKNGGSAGKNGSSSDGASAPETPRRGPLSPLGRFLLKLKLYALMPLVWLSKTLAAMMRNRLFAALFGIFVATSAALGVRAVQMRKAAIKPRAAPTVLYSHFVKDLSAKKVAAVRFEEGTGRILYELKEGAATSAPPKPTPPGKPKGKLNILQQRQQQAGAIATENAAVSTVSIPKRTILQTKRIPDEKLMTRLEAAGVEFGSIAAPATSVLSKGALTAMALWIPLVPLYFMFRNMANKQGGGGNAKKARAPSNEKPVTFDDVAGVDAAKAELVELVEMLKSADKYKGVKNRLPTGCLLVGPPGTGKTLLAKAVAGEAGVPFFAVAASEFVELFVGRGAARVRELFAEARKASPAVVFIDELDAIGARRGAGLNEERDQTLNQMLVEMDGFNKPRGLLVLAATNRAEALDPALLRPGRLTRRVFVGPPDFAGRAQILAVHLRGVQTAESLAATCDAVARVTGGFTGAELANVVNEGVLLAARDDREVVTVDDLFSGAERTRNGVGVGQGAAAVLSGLRKLMQGGDPREVLKEVRDGSDRNGGGPSGGGGFGGGGRNDPNDPSNISEANARQGVGMSMPPT